MLTYAHGLSGCGLYPSSTPDTSHLTRTHAYTHTCYNMQLRITTASTGHATAYQRWPLLGCMPPAPWSWTWRTSAQAFSKQTQCCSTELVWSRGPQLHAGPCHLAVHVGNIIPNGPWQGQGGLSLSNTSGRIAPSSLAVLPPTPFSCHFDTE